MQHFQHRIPVVQLSAWADITLLVLFCHYFHSCCTLYSPAFIVSSCIPPVGFLTCIKGFNQDTNFVTIWRLRFLSYWTWFHAVWQWFVDLLGQTYIFHHQHVRTSSILKMEAIVSIQHWWRRPHIFFLTEIRVVCSSWNHNFLPDNTASHLYGLCSITYSLLHDNRRSSAVSPKTMTTPFTHTPTSCLT